MKQPTTSPTFCIMPWIHINASVAGKYRPCCNSDADFGERDTTRNVDDAFTDIELTEVRRSMVNGERHEACRVCWNRESAGVESHRETYTTKKFKRFVDPEALPKLQYLDMRFDNTCNLECRMCDPASSNKLQNTIDWYLDNDKPLPEHWKIFHQSQSPNVIKALAIRRRDYTINELRNLRILKVTGGEPFMSNEFNAVLDAAIKSGDSKHIALNITTNGTKFTNKILDKLTHFESINFNISVDGIGDTYDYIRYPFKWNKWVERFENLLQWLDGNELYKQPGFAIRTSALISAYNWLNAPELYSHLVKYTDKYPWTKDIYFDFNLNLRPDDSELSAKWLPAHILDEGLRRWQETDYNQVKEIAAYVENSKSLDPDTRKLKNDQLMYMTVTLDYQRRQCFSSLDPMLVEWMNNG